MDIRTLVLAASIFCATFLAGWWLNIGAMLYGTATSHAQPAAVAAAPTTEQQAQSQTSSGGRPRVVLHLPQTPSTQAPRSKAPQAKAPRSAQAKEMQAQEARAPRKSSIRIRRR
jgi:hypothetical protein